MIFKPFILFFSILFSLQTFAADLKGVSKIFQQTFWTSHYENGFCGKNIEKLVRKAVSKRVDLTGAQILQISDTSGWMFGMLNALQAREQGKLIIPARNSPARHPGEKNWYFHVVLLVEGRVLDYDFTNTPQLLPMKDYLEAMFIPTNKKHDPSYKLSKMKGYKILSFPAEDYILRQQQGLSTSEVSSESYLKHFLPEFF